MPRFAILVIAADGELQYIRDGAESGRGPVATWVSKARAEQQAEMWREGLGEDVQSVNVVRYHEAGKGRRDATTV